MTAFRSRVLAPVLAAAALAVSLSTAALAHDYTVGSLKIDHPWARASAGKAANGAAFLSVVNSGADDRLVAAETPVADRAELHTHTMENGVMKMRQVEGGIAIPAGQTVMLQPGGLHVMLFGLKAPLKEKDSVPLTLTFEKAGSVKVDIKVESLSAGAQPQPQQHKMH